MVKVYYSKTAIRYVLAFLGLECGLIFGVAIVIATKQPLRTMWGAIALAIALSVGSLLLLWPSRERWSYTFETDGDTWIRRWGGKEDVLIRSHEVERIERVAFDITVHSRTGATLAVTPDATGYRELRELIERWDRDRSLASSPSG